VRGGGKLLAYGAGDVVHLCEADSGKEVRQFKTADGDVLTLAFTPDGKTLAVRGQNHRVRLWETATGKELHQLADAEPARRGGGFVLTVPGTHGPESRALAVSPDGSRVAAAAGSTVSLWETATGKELPLLDGHWRAPSAIILSGDGKEVISWGGDRVIRRWEAATGRPLGAFPAPAGTTLAAFAADGRTAALANRDNTIRLHETVTGKELRRIKGPPNGTAALAFAPGAKVLAARGRGDDTIRLYDVARGAELRQIAVRRKNNNPDGRLVIFLNGGGGSRGTGPGLAFSPDGKLVVAPLAGGGGERSNTLVFFDAATGKELRKIQSPQPVASFAFSPDGRTLAAENADRTITLWEVASARERGRLGQAVAPRQPQGGGMMTTIAIDGDGFPDGFSGPAGPVGLAFSPDGRALAVRGPDRAVHLWDVVAGQEVGRLAGHGGRVETVAFAAGGKDLASGAADTTVLLWDVAGPMKGLAKPPPVGLPAAEAEALWQDLAGEDASRALRGVRKLAAAPGPGAALLGGRLKPAARIDPEKISRWIAGLEDEKFAVRQEAAANLLKAGDQAVPALRKVLDSSPPLETRKRAEDLLDRLTGGLLTAEQLRVVRAVEALEGMGTPEARRLLQTLAGGAPGALPTREAQAALDRLGAARP
jgi:WD40 repeat protein